MNHPRLLTLVGLVLLAIASPAAAAEPDDLEAQVTAMAKIGASGSPSFSPDGKRIALVSSLSGTNQAWIVSSQGGWPEQLTSLNGNVGNTHWSPDGRWIAFHFTPAGGGGQQVYVIRPDGTGLRRLTDGGKEQNFLDGWSHDSRYLMIASDRLAGKSIDTFLYDLERGEMRLISATPALDELVDISRDGKYGLVFHQTGRGDNDVSLVDLQTLQEQNLTPHTPPSLFENASFAPDGSAVYMSTNKDREIEVLARVKLTGGHPGPLEIVAERAGNTVEQFALSPDGKCAAVSWNVAGQSMLNFLDLATLEQGPPVPVPNDIITQLRFSPDSSELATLVIGTAAPPNIWILNRASNQFRQITSSSHPGVDLSRIVRPVLVKYKAHDGLTISGWLYRPRQATGPQPLVVILHGGPEAQERPTFLGTYQALVQRGIMVFAPNVRGSSGFGKSFTHLDDGALRTNAVRDVKSGVDYLVAQGMADPAHVGVFGFSSGGFLVLSAIVQFPGTFKAGGMVSGLVDLEGFFQKTERWMANISKSEYGDPEKDAAMLHDLSPINKVDTVNIPLLVIHGALDTNVPVEQADRVVESLKRRQIPVSYLRFPDERHGVGEFPNRIRYSVAVVRWFTTYLKGDATAESHAP